MSHFSIAEMQRAVGSAQAPCFPAAPVSDGLVERIRQILLPSEHSRSVNNARELAPLLRHYLHREKSRIGQDVQLKVPRTDRWPDLLTWRRHGVHAFPFDADWFLISPLPWSPDWLDGAVSGVFAAAYGNGSVRAKEHCPADPFFSAATGHGEYSCPGQREAVRAALLMPAGETLLVNLPTGSGKSLVGHIPSLVHDHDGAITIFIVPTVALAIDQERQMLEYFARQSPQTWPLAWHGGSSAEVRAEIRERLRNGTQRILFTSPEAITTTLLHTVFATCRAGMLRYLVIDEAHLVTQWGDEFRPAFQALAGLRNGLLRVAPGKRFRTLLLSATFTPETVETLATLFGPPSKFQAVSAVHLRPEPQYWFSRAENGEEKVQRVLETLRHAPRPFVLYVTTRADAHFWLQMLRQEIGTDRIACFEGGTPDVDRQRIIYDWIHNRLDGVVATSAFGVGIDKPDVRTIVHATIPETLDRYYQEVGRGGRDGQPSASIVIYDDEDWSLPERLATPAIISNELGLNRWSALYRSRRHDEGDDLFPVDLGSVPSQLHGGSQYNVDWNMRTLLLMCRAGLIELDIQDADSSIDESDAVAMTSMEVMASVRIRILDHGHLLPSVWEQRINPARQRTFQSTKRNLRLLRELLIQRREVSQVLADLYRTTHSLWPVDVTRTCGGCPSDRNDVAGRGYHVPTAAPIARAIQPDLARWRQSFPWLDPTPVYIFFDPTTSADTLRRSVLKVVGWLVAECNVLEVTLDKHCDVFNGTEWAELYKRSPEGFVIHRVLGGPSYEPYTPLARITVLGPNVGSDALLDAAYIRRPFHAIILPIDSADPHNKGRQFVHTASNAIGMNEILERLAQ